MGGGCMTERRDTMQCIMAHTVWLLCGGLMGGGAHG